MATRNWKAEEEARALRERIVTFVEEFTDREGFGPTREEVAEAMHVNLRTARRHLKALLDDGVLEEPSGPRSLRFKI